MKKLLKISVLGLITVISTNSYSQELDVNLQIRPRYEYRNGYKTLLPKGQKGTSQTSQRSRLNFNYKQEQLSV
jgi:hypothetical protein